MTRPRMTTDAERAAARRVIDGTAVYEIDCRPGHRGRCRRAGCPQHGTPPTDPPEEVGALPPAS